MILTIDKNRCITKMAKDNWVEKEDREYSRSLLLLE